MFMVCVAAEMVSSRSGSKMTMSASAPGAIVPLRGASPKIRAGSVEVRRTSSGSVSRPARTARSWRSERRNSIAGSPLGIFVKSSRPSSF
jgi:hypothetical protein